MVDGSIYQENLATGEAGQRNCADRWEIIKPYICNWDVVVDVGSNLGYFGIKIAQEYPDSFVWSIENHWAEKQKEILKGAGIKNIALCDYTLNLTDYSHLSRTCEAIDLFLMLSVIQYNSLAEALEILWQVSRIAPRLIIEIPNIDEENSLKGFDLEGYIRKIYRGVKVIGITKDMGGHDRKIIYAFNLKIWREGVNASLYSLSDRKHDVFFFNGEWTIGLKKILKGVNLGDLLCWNLVYPEEPLKGAAEAYAKIPEATDVNPFNVIFDGDYKPIDCDEDGEKAGADIEKHLEWQMNKVKKWSNK